MMNKDKSTIEEIRERFDNDLERFSNLETGQSATIDAPIALELVAHAAHASTPHATTLLDIGCGAGNFSLRYLALNEVNNIHLVDLSKPMLDRATERIGSTYQSEIHCTQTDVRDLDLGEAQYDVVLAGAVLHHLRSEKEWEATFLKIYHAIKPGGSFWIFDMIKHNSLAIHNLMQKRYRAYLSALKDDEYAQHVFDYIEKEDSPAPLTYQLDLLKQVGFAHVELLHMNTRFAAFGGLKA